MKFIVITSKNKDDGVLISFNIKHENYYPRTNIEIYSFDGEKIIDTYHKHWYKIGKIPTKITELSKEHKINKRWELKEEFYTLKDFDKIVYECNSYKDCEECGESESCNKVHNIRNPALYDYKFDIELQKEIEVEFSYEVIAEVDSLSSIDRKIEYKIEHQLLDKILFPEPILIVKPSKITSTESFKIIREYIKRNINYDYANITSDYDSGISIKKKIRYNEPQKQVSYDYTSSGKKKKNPRIWYNKHELIEVFSCSPSYSQCYKTIAPEFIGKDYNDVENQINNYLKELIEFINKPFVYCDKCNGEGVVIDKFEPKKGGE